MKANLTKKEMATNICLSAGVGYKSFDTAVERICKMRKERLEFRYNELEELKDVKMYKYFVSCVTDLLLK